LAGVELVFFLAAAVLLLLVGVEPELLRAVLPLDELPLDDLAGGGLLNSWELGAS
jgi:hypothetical protein